MNKFNLRVYGILINEKEEILLSSEFRYGKSMIKFPGGGLEFGEGLKECLLREFQEECGIEVKIGELFYVNDFLQVSAFKEEEQLISFYYFINYENWIQLETVGLDFRHEIEGEKLVWYPLVSLSKEVVTFPIDKVVAQMLVNTKGVFR